MHTVGQRMTMKNNNRDSSIQVRLQYARFVSIKSGLKKIVETSRDVIASLLFPPRCPVCDGILEPEEIQKGIHSICESKLYPVTGSVCMHCGKPLVMKGQPVQKNYKNTQQKEIKNEYFEFGDSLEFCHDCTRLLQVRTRSAIGQNHVSCLHQSRSESVLGRSNVIGSHITQAKSLYIYRGVIKHTMYKFKYSNKREYARFFAQQAVEHLGWWLGADVIIPVPMYEPKRKARGYNQAESFAEELSKLTGIPVDKKIIKRVKDTTPQKELNPIERKNNLKNAFQTQQNSVQYSHALIVDDIYTTGSTAEAVAKELIKTGVRQVYVLTVCIGGDM